MNDYSKINRIQNQLTPETMKERKFDKKKSSKSTCFVGIFAVVVGMLRLILDIQWCETKCLEAESDARKRGPVRQN